MKKEERGRDWCEARRRRECLTRGTTSSLLLAPGFQEGSAPVSSERRKLTYSPVDTSCVVPEVSTLEKERKEQKERGRHLLSSRDPKSKGKKGTYLGLTWSSGWKTHFCKDLLEGMKVVVLVGGRRAKKRKRNP